MFSGRRCVLLVEHSVLCLASLLVACQGGLLQVDRMSFFYSRESPIRGRAERTPRELFDRSEGPPHRTRESLSFFDLLTISGESMVRPTDASVSRESPVNRNASVGLRYVGRSRE